MEHKVKMQEEQSTEGMDWNKVQPETLEVMAALMQGFKDNLPDLNSSSAQEREDAEFVAAFKAALARARGQNWYSFLPSRGEIKSSQPRYLTKAELKRRGWTDVAISRFLREPDKRKPNPHYKNGAPMQLWERSRVKAIESSQAWYQWVAESQRRSLALRKSRMRSGGK